MRLAFTISSYRLFDFVHLGIKQLRKLCGPDVPILISDDHAVESQYIRQLAKEHGVEYMGSDKKRGHFSGDAQSLVNAISFGVSAGADVAIKVSQRFIFRLPESIKVIERAFAKPEMLIAIPGQPKRAFGSKAAKGFSNFAVLSDVVMVRPSIQIAARFLQLYRHRITTETVPWKTFIEPAVHAIFNDVGPERSQLIPELTDHMDQANPIYFRRYQNTEEQYRALAATHGILGRFPVVEWGMIEGRMYMAQPVVI